ncbi:hypothetical protein O5624_05500 [Escherichia coli]|nr:hypothetical protein [Escherichia coli]
MTSSLARVNWDDFTESVPAFITTVMMPFTFSITEGIALGFMSYCIMKVCTGRWRDLNLCVVVVASSVCTEDYSGGLVTGEGFQIS